VPVLLGNVLPTWRNLFATALYTGMRKGELFGLRASDVDLDGRTITVARSYDRPTTKGGHADVIPIAAWTGQLRGCWPLVRTAKAVSGRTGKSEVFGRIATLRGRRT
jgi:integrase